MAEKGIPSYTDLVYDVMKSAERPLTFQEIFDAVNQRRPVTTRNPQSTIRSAISQGRQLVSLGDGHFGYLPSLVNGSLVRLPLTEGNPADHNLIFPDEVCHALWPSFSDNQKRRLDRPIRARLPDGNEVALSFGFLGPNTWGTRPPDRIRRYLIENQATAGDSLLLRVVDAAGGRVEARFEARRQQNQAAVAARNQNLADAAYETLRRSQRSELTGWDLVILLLAQGHYRNDVAPASLIEVLRADPRFVSTGLAMWMLTEAMSPDKQILIRERERFFADFFQISGQAMPGPEPVGPPSSARHGLAGKITDITTRIAAREAEAIDAVSDFLTSIMRPNSFSAHRSTTPLEQAQEIVDEAWAASTPRRRIRLAEQALAISPDCADAYVLLADESARTPEQAADLYAKGVAAGERALGEWAFKHQVGHFWGIFETRPYMRARFGLAQAIWAIGRQQAAIDHLADMLRLNPNDNQGVRYVLLNWLLELGDDTRAGGLLDAYSDDASAVWSYGRALQVFRAEGDSAHARLVLAEALEQNRLVPRYLLGRRRLPKTLPATVGFGDDSEAVYCAAEQLAAWQREPAALAWLAKHAG